MKIQQKLELKAEEFSKCYLVADIDCPLGQLFDYSCMLQSYIRQKIKESEEKKEQEKVNVESENS